MVVRHMLGNLIFNKVEIPSRFSFLNTGRITIDREKDSTWLALRYTYKYSNNSRVLLEKVQQFIQSLDIEWGAVGT